MNSHTSNDERQALFGLWMAIGAVAYNAWNALVGLLSILIRSEPFSPATGPDHIFRTFPVYAGTGAAAILVIVGLSRIASRGAGRFADEALARMGRPCTAAPILLGIGTAAALFHLAIAGLTTRNGVPTAVHWPAVTDGLFALGLSAVAIRWVPSTRADHAPIAVSAEDLIRHWRRELALTHGVPMEAIRELEAHLRDSIHEWQAAGVPENAALERSLARLGSAEMIAAGLRQADPAGVWNLRVAGLLAGALALSLITFTCHVVGMLGWKWMSLLLGNAGSQSWFVDWMFCAMLPRLLILVALSWLLGFVGDSRRPGREVHWHRTVQRITWLPLLIAVSLGVLQALTFLNLGAGTERADWRYPFVVVGSILATSVLPLGAMALLLHRLTRRLHADFTASTPRSA